MLVNGIQFNEKLVQAIKKNNLVVFAGAGVSMNSPTNMPSFVELVEFIIKGTHMEFDVSSDKPDLFLGKLEHEGMNVKKKVSSFFSSKEIVPNDLHKNIVNLFYSPTQLRIITTNFEDAFERSSGPNDYRVYASPALPLGDDFNGIVHIHGTYEEPRNMILTDSDFGKGYLLDGYVSRFLSKMFSTYTVLFIGYSYDDTIMRYLSRALPISSDVNRYILTNEKEKEWDSLGLIPIIFPQAGYSILIEAIGMLSKRVFNKPLDWKIEIKSYAKNGPPISEEEQDKVKQILNDEELFSIFREEFDAKNFESWFKWLNENMLIKHLVTENCRNNYEMTNWIIDIDIDNCRFANTSRFISEGNLIKNSGFYAHLFERLQSKNENIENEVYEKILIIFLDEIHRLSDIEVVNLIEECVKRGLIFLAFEIFKNNVTPRFFLKENLFYDNKDNQIRGEFVGVNYYYSNLWKNVLSNHHNSFVDSIFSHLISMIEKQDIIYRKFNNIKENYVKYMFIDIEKDWLDNKSIHPETLESLFTRIIYDSLLIYEKRGIGKFENKLDKLLKSNSSILHKIALISIKNSKKLNATKKYKYIYRYTLYESDIKTEIFRLVSSVYPYLNDTRKTQILRKIDKKLVNSDIDSSVKYSNYNWYIWLRNNCPEDKLIHKNYEKNREYYEGFLPREKPELLAYSTDMRIVSSISPLTLKDIDLMSITDIVDYLSNFSDYNSSYYEEVTKERLYDVIFEKMSVDLCWRLDLMIYLKEQGVLGERIWEYLFKGLEKEISEKCALELVLNEIIDEELIKEQGVVVSKFIYELLGNTEISIYDILNNDKVIISILDSLYNNPTHNSDVDRDDLIYRSISGTSYYSSIAFLRLIILNDNESGIKEEYIQHLSKVFDENRDISIYYVYTIVGNYRVIFEKDNTVFDSFVLPKLISKNNDIFAAAWQGLLKYTPVLYEDVASKFIDSYEYALDNIGVLHGKTRTKFIDSYSVLIIHVFKNPIKAYSKLLSRIRKNERKYFFDALKRMLESMDIKQREELWDTWLNGIYGNIEFNIPIKYDDQDMINLVRIVKYSESNFCKVVDILIKHNSIIITEPQRIEGLLKYIDNYYIDEKYTESIRKLRAYLISCEYPKYFDKSRLSGSK